MIVRHIPKTFELDVNMKKHNKLKSNKRTPVGDIIRKKNSSNPDEQNSTLKQSRFRGSFKLMIWLFSVPIVSIAAYFTVYAFVAPKIIIESPTLSGVSDPYSSFFKVQNQGYLSINNIAYLINIKDCMLYDTEKGYLDIMEKDGEWFSYSTPKRQRVKSNLEPMQSDTPPLKFTSYPFDELCREGRELVIQMDYRLDYFPFELRKLARFNLHYSETGLPQWIPTANYDDFIQDFNAVGTDKAWVILQANAHIFKDTNRVLEAHQIALISVPPERRTIP